MSRRVRALPAQTPDDRVSRRVRALPVLLSHAPWWVLVVLGTATGARCAGTAPPASELPGWVPGHGMTGKTARDYSDDYSDPELRERLKEQIKAGDRGGRPGQWSARKSQLLVSEYERAGGGYRHEGERTESQQHLHQWTEQDWHTSDGSAEARDGEDTARYLPDAAWHLLTPEEQRATDRAKLSGDGQHVANTEAAREARAAAELIDVPAREARERVGRMHGSSQLDRAEQAERELGTGRKTVLDRIERQRAAD